MDLPKLDEPVGLRARVAIEPDAVRAEIASGRFITTPVWKAWGTGLAGTGIDRATLAAILRGYDYEVWLWAAGERTWAQCVEGLAGRLRRRLGAPPRKAKPTRAKPIKAKTASKTGRARRPRKAAKPGRAGAARRTRKGGRAAKASRAAVRTMPKKAAKATKPRTVKAKTTKAKTTKAKTTKARTTKARTTKARTTKAATVRATRSPSGAGGKRAAKTRAKTTRARKPAGPVRKTRRR